MYGMPPMEGSPRTETVVKVNPRVQFLYLHPPPNTRCISRRLKAGDEIESKDWKTDGEGFLSFTTSWHAILFDKSERKGEAGDMVPDSVIIIETNE